MTNFYLALVRRNTENITAFRDKVTDRRMTFSHIFPTCSWAEKYVSGLTFQVLFDTGSGRKGYADMFTAVEWTSGGAREWYWGCSRRS